MAVFVTSDLHFFHRNIIKYYPKFRNYANPTEMNEGIIEIINRTVSAEDTLYILGDLALSKRPTQVLRLLEQINCMDIRVVPGNHDCPKLLEALGDRVLPPIHEIEHLGEKIVLCHFPLITWNQSGRGSLHLYGHSHGSLVPELAKGRKQDVGWDVYGKPVDLDELVLELRTREIWNVDHH